MRKQYWLGLLWVFLMLGYLGSGALAVPVQGMAEDTAILNSAPPEAPTGIALVAGDTVDPTWHPEDYPDGTFIRLELYRGFSTDTLEWIATVSSASVWRYRDTGLAADTNYTYRAILYYYPASSPSDEYTTTLFTASADTGRLNGRVFASIALPGGVYDLGTLTVYEPAVLTVPSGVRTKTSGTIKALNATLHIDGATFAAQTTLAFGATSPAAWGTGWVHDAATGEDSRISVYGDRAVDISGNALGQYSTIDATTATGTVVVRNNSGESHVNLGGMGIATGNTLRSASAYGDVTLEGNVFESISVNDNATARLNRITGKATGYGTSTLEYNTIAGELTLRGEVLARYNDLSGGVEAGDHSQLEENVITGDVTVDEDAAGVTLLRNTITGGALVVANDYSCDNDPATAYAEGNLIDCGWNCWAVKVYGGAHATLVNNEINGSLDVGQECTQFTAHQNVIDGGFALCWTPAVTITENIVDGSINVGSAFPATCSGDASGTIARNTLQGNLGEYSAPALYLSRRLYTESHAGLAVQHNCFQNNTIAARLFTIPDHGLVDLRDNWWDDVSGPNYPTNPGGAGGRIENLQNTPLTFDPWDTTPAYCREAIPITHRPADLEIELPDTVRPDGVSQVPVQVTVLDQYGWPLADASVSLSLIPEGLGQLDQDAAVTDAYGQATVWYTAPSLDQLGQHGEVEIRALSGAAQDWGVLAFEEPATLHTAEPRYHQDGWSEWRALLPPDPHVPATLHAKLTYDGEPVRNYTVTAEIEPLDGGVYDGIFIEGSNVVPSLDEHEVTLLTDENGEVWVKYQYTGQTSRQDSVRDGVRLRSDAFAHLASWEIETGMDLQLVDIRRPGASQNDYLVMGTPEPLEIIVRDGLHPGFHLSHYNDNPDVLTNPFVGVWLDIGETGTLDEFFDLLLIDHLRIPGEHSYATTLELAGDDQVYMRTFDGENINGRPVLTPRFAGWNVYWIGVHLQRNADGLVLRDTYPAGQTDNNYEMLRFQANAEMTAWELFLRNNPCAPNTPWGKAAKCTLNILTWFPATAAQASVASTLLSVCETLFNVANGQVESAALGAGNLYGGELESYLTEHPEVLAGTGYGPGMATLLGKLGTISKVLDCYNALPDWPGAAGNSPSAGLCSLQERIAPPQSAAAQTAAQSMLTPDQTAVWVQGLLQSTGGSEAELDALAVLGSQQTQVIDAITGQTVVTVAGAMTDTLGTYFSLVNDLGSVYLLPPSHYTVTAHTVTDTHVLLFRKGVTMTAFSTVAWEDAGDTARQISFTFGPTATTALSVDEGADGSIERSVPAEETPHLLAPANVQATRDESYLDRVQVAWSPVADAYGYRVYYGTESRWMPSFTAYSNHTEVYTTSKTIFGLALDDWAYYVTVTTLDADGHESLYGAEVTVGKALRSRPVYLPLVLKRR